MTSSDPRSRVVRYLRMSTAQQPQSLALQAEAIEAYAKIRNYKVIRTYEDAAVSGVATDKRPAFRTLLATVLGGQADFEAILVYDVSRWGRFQDPDEAAHYEFLSAREGVRIEYCTEGFNGASKQHEALLKGLKRAMAAEYSRELGAKVTSAQRRLAAKGHWQHGPPGYGLRRQLVGADGRLGAILQAGQRKADPSQHTILVRGPRHEVETIRRMHRLCREGAPPGEIARRLNQAGVLGPSGGLWSGERVRDILGNPKYSGALVTGRRHTPLGGKRRATTPDTWITAPGASPALVSARTFAATQQVLLAPTRPEIGQLLEMLREIATVHGMVSEDRLKALGVPHPRIYRARFGSLQAAYAAIGCTPGRGFPKKMDEDAMLRGLACLFEREGDLTSRLVDADRTIPSADHYRRRFTSLAIAYARIGFVRITSAEARSPLGQARLEARRVRIASWSLPPRDRR